MAKKIFGLRGVPEDEADDIRQLLSENRIDYYETTAGNWGVSMPAIWLEDEQQFPQAKKLIDAYEAERSVRVRDEYERQKKAGENETLQDRLKRDPVTYIITIAFILFLLYIFIGPFVSIGK